MELYSAERFTFFNVAEAIINYCCITGHCRQNEKTSKRKGEKVTRFHPENGLSRPLAERSWGMTATRCETGTKQENS